MPGAFFSCECDSNPCRVDETPEHMLPGYIAQCLYLWCEPGSVHPFVVTPLYLQFIDVITASHSPCDGNAAWNLLLRTPGRPGSPGGGRTRAGTGGDPRDVGSRADGAMRSAVAAAASL